ncbi:MAG TPA: hypothetical protein DHW82_01515 [Spirochaetia bacterium]|nr:MAG: hypothetical protein A2Y41_12910 [Spirochaetes bacterium GWB1_36_13]HCL55674.1 hypothetical protein [Spirochaetia bacterium]
MHSKKENLDKIVKSLEEKVHIITTEDREGVFLVENSGKKITLIFQNKEEISGELLDIDKNRILIKINEREYYYYKHAITGYYRN